MDQHWEDQYISHDPNNGLWTCWDQKGENIGVANDYDTARRVVQDYVEKRIRNKDKNDYKPRSSSW